MSTAPEPSKELIGAIARTSQWRQALQDAGSDDEEAPVSARSADRGAALGPGTVRLSGPGFAALRRPQFEVAAEPGLWRGDVLPFLLAGAQGEAQLCHMFGHCLLRQGGE